VQTAEALLTHSEQRLSLRRQGFLAMRHCSLTVSNASVFAAKGSWL